MNRDYYDMNRDYYDTDDQSDSYEKDDPSSDEEYVPGRKILVGNDGKCIDKVNDVEKTIGKPAALLQQVRTLHIYVHCHCIAQQFCSDSQKIRKYP